MVNFMKLLRNAYREWRRDCCKKVRQLTEIKVLKSAVIYTGRSEDLSLLDCILLFHFLKEFFRFESYSRLRK